jgi:hypothetical protein
MALNYDPEDAKKAGAWPVAEYDGELVKVEETFSKKKPDGSGGNPMEVWTFKFYNPDGREKLISEYVPENEWTAVKVRNLARAVGCEDEFNARKFQAGNHIGDSVRAKLVVESSDGYDDKNKIGKFIPIPKAPAAAKAPVGNLREQVAARPKAAQPFGDEKQFEGDDIPFDLAPRR